MKVQISVIAFILALALAAPLGGYQLGNRAMNAAADADLFFAIGTSLQVYPIAGALPAAHTAGARIVIVNAQATPFDDVADAVYREPIGTILPQLFSA